jgi:hypothetical protein
LHPFAVVWVASNSGHRRRLKRIIGSLRETNKIAERVQRDALQKEISKETVRPSLSHDLPTPPATPPSLDGLRQLAQALKERERLPDGMPVDASQPGDPVDIHRRESRQDRPPRSPTVFVHVSRPRRTSSTDSLGNTRAPSLRRRSGADSIRVPPPRGISLPECSIGDNRIQKQEPRVLSVAKKLGSLTAWRGRVVGSRGGGSVTEKMVSGFVDPELAQNIMSSATAGAIGVQVQPCKPGDPEFVRLARDNVVNAEIVGSFEAIWTEAGVGNAAESRGVVLKTWVYMSAEEGLILGRPYVTIKHQGRSE